MEHQTLRRGMARGLAALGLVACHSAVRATSGVRATEPCLTRELIADAGVSGTEEPCAIVARLQRAAIAALPTATQSAVVVPSDSVFRRCQRLDAGAVGLLVESVTQEPRSRKALASLKAVYVSERGDILTTSPIRVGLPNEIVVRARADGPPFVAVQVEAGPLAQDPAACASTRLVEVPFGRSVSAALAPDTFSSMIMRPPIKADDGSLAIPLQWTHIEWIDGGPHRLDIHLPGMCTRTPVPYGGSWFEASRGLEASIRFDDNFAPLDSEQSVKASLAAACDALGDMERAAPESMFQAAVCARLRGTPSSSVSTSWTMRCDSLARGEETWGTKNWTSGKRALSAEARRTRPPIPPRLCFREADRLWDADYTAQSSHRRPPAIVPDDLADVLERVLPLLTAVR